MIFSYLNFLIFYVTASLINRLKGNDLMMKTEYSHSKEIKYSKCIYEISTKESLIIDLSLIKWPLEWYLLNLFY